MTEGVSFTLPSLARSLTLSLSLSLTHLSSPVQLAISLLANKPAMRTHCSTFSLCSSLSSPPTFFFLLS